MEIYFFLPIILALGVLTSYEDIKLGKIKNKYLLIAAGIGFVIQCFLILFEIITVKYLLISIIYTIISLIVGFVLWYYGIWNAGDAKLLTILVFLTPPTIYKNVTTQLPFIDLFLNSLIPIFIYLLINMFIKSSKKEKIEAVKETLNLKNIFFAVVTIFSITWINPYLFPYLKIQPNIITNMLLIIFGFKLLEKILQENTHAFLIMVSIFRVFLNQQYFMTKTFLISFITMILLYIILLGFIRRLSDVYSNEVNISQLKSGMILGEGILKNGLKAPIKQSLRDTYILTKATALSKTDVQKIKKWHMTGKLHFNKIKVNKTIAFAPHLFLGTIITISCQGNILLFLQKVFL